jgi:formylglycine-generating enzyme required for sulfatase activity
MRAAAALLILAGCATAPSREGLRPLGRNAQGAQECLRAVDGMVVIRIPAGEFVMGADDGDPEEKPRRVERTGEYWIDKFEVTNAQFAKFLNAVGRERDEEGRPLIDPSVSGLVKNENGEWRAAPGRDLHPVAAATWFGAAAYARWVGGRLPTDLEWEKAARGADGRTYPWGEETPDAARCNFSPAGVGDTSPVGSFPSGASPYGCMDMAGNVYERVARRRAAGGESSSIKSSAFFCPLAFQMRAADYCGYARDRSHAGVGFRCVMDADAR